MSKDMQLKLYQVNINYMTNQVKGNSVKSIKGIKQEDLKNMQSRSSVQTNLKKKINSNSAIDKFKQ